MESPHKSRIGWPLLIGIILSVAVCVQVASANLTFTGTNISGDTSIVVDGPSTISIGTSTATGITIGNSSGTTSFFGNVGIGTTTRSSALAISTIGSPATLPFSITGDPSQSTDLWDAYKGSTLMGKLDQFGDLMYAGRLLILENGSTSTVVQALYSEAGTDNLILRAGTIANRIAVKDSSLNNIASFIGGPEAFAIGSGSGYANIASSSAPANGMIVQGKVGIGTSTPSTNLQVADPVNDSSTIRIGSASKHSCLEMAASSGTIGATVYIYFDSNAAIYATTTEPSFCQ